MDLPEGVSEFPSQCTPAVVRAEIPCVAAALETPRDFLYHGLPCVWDGDRYVIFSPYALKIARVEEEAIRRAGTKEYLQQQEFFGEPARPPEVTTTARFGLILITGCNLRCKYCYVVPDTRARSMSPEYALRVIREKVTPNTKKVSLSFFGGEPTLNMPTLKAAVERVKELGIPHQFIINTNGTAPDADLDYLVSNDFIFIVSSDGPPEITDDQRPSLSGAAAARSVERTITRLVSGDCLFQVRATVTERSVRYISEAMRYWGELGVQFVHIEPVGASNNSKLFSVSCPDSGKYVSAILSALDEAERRSMWVISSPYMNLLTPSTYFCTTVAGEKEMYAPDGAISTCYRVQEKEHVATEFLVGQYDDSTDTFQRHGGRAKRLKEIEVRSGGPCATCHARYICAGGCPFRNRVEAGHILGVDPWSCAVKKALVHDAVMRIAAGLEQGRVPVAFGESVFERSAAQRFVG